MTASELHGEDELRAWLEAQGFRCAPDNLRYQENGCNWYAYRRSALPARSCQCNSDKPGMQIIVKPSAMHIGDFMHRSVSVELTGEFDAVWWKLSAYSLRPEEVPEKLDKVEASLIAAWNVLAHPR